MAKSEAGTVVSLRLAPEVVDFYTDRASLLGLSRNQLITEALGSYAAQLRAGLRTLPERMLADGGRS